DNREDFDKFEPGPVVWHNISQELKKPMPKKGIMVSMKAIRWSAAASVMLVLGAGGLYLFNSGKKDAGQQVAVTDTPAKKETATDTAVMQPVKEKAQTNDKNIASTETETPDEAPAKDEFNEELVHYTRLVEIKQNQIKKIKKDEPLLYQKFAGDFQRLDSTFHILKNQLPVNPNREQLLEAMIQNLQLQTALLNQQLNIIRQINQSKKLAYDKAYRSV
ncbi:MAG: hypothetical protein H7Y27_04685, partial [Gemmatimonadaceae bacterium]|nr:hypothetical protein [Chitinophagaceae bacterium]